MHMHACVCVSRCVSIILYMYIHIIYTHTHEGTPTNHPSRTLPVTQVGNKLRADLTRGASDQQALPIVVALTSAHVPPGLGLGNSGRGVDAAHRMGVG